MGNIQAILNQRVKKNENSSKMAVMAKQSSAGQLSSFSGIFGVAELSSQEKTALELLLQQFDNGSESKDSDLQQLISITSEVKAINNQAAILHGERIKKAHAILTRYRDGAFTAWLIATYGNRQTPYNLMQYFEFYDAMPKNLRPLLEEMPRQAVYTLASRTGEMSAKQQIVSNYKGETKAELLSLIRQLFPLEKDDKRRSSMGENAIQILEKLLKQFKVDTQPFTKHQKQTILDLLDQIRSLDSLS